MARHSTHDGRCPACGEYFDKLLSPAMRIVGGSVTTFCSDNCANDAERAGGVTKKRSITAGWDDDEALAGIPDGGAQEVPLEQEGMSNTLKLWAAVGAALVAGAATTVVMLMSGDHPSPAAASQPAPQIAKETVQVPSEPQETPEERDARIVKELRVEALGTLNAYLKNGSYRVKLIAAKALIRTGSPAAEKILLDALEKDPSDIRKLEVARALFRQGNERAKEYLVKALDSRRRDVRLEAARALAAFGDHAGEEQLKRALSIRTLRLSAAESLALLGSPEGFDELNDTLNDRNREFRIRASVALGHAGDASGRKLLLELIDEPLVELGAATALARLGDKKAVPALTRALGLTALRVQAAASLKRLKVKVDHAKLASAMSNGDDLARISACEAMLILVDPTLKLPPLPPGKTGLAKEG